MSEIQITAINGMGAITDLGGGSFSTTGMEANDHMHISEDFLDDAGIVNSGDYSVAQASVPGKKVTVSGGVAYVLNSNYSALSLSEQKFWRAKMGGDTDVTITDNTSGNPRIDIICIKVDATVTPNGEATNVASLVAVAGTPAASPTAPAVPDDHLLLAQVAVANGFTSITTANITDKRASCSVNNNSGWIQVPDTWAYASATTITVPSGAVSKYQKGMPFKLTANSVELQGYIVGIADTVLTVAGDTLTNHIFTNNYYAHSGTSPVGFKNWFNWTPSYGGTGSLTYTSVTTTKAIFALSGNTVHFKIYASGTTGGTTSADLTFTAPVTGSSNEANYQTLCFGEVSDDGAFMAWGRWNATSRTTIMVSKYNSANFGLGSNKVLLVAGFYSI